MFEERVSVPNIVIKLAFVPSHHNSYNPMSQQAVKDSPPGGLTSDETSRKLEKFGPNAVRDTAQHPLRMALEKFWAPFPGCSRPRSCSRWCLASMSRPRSSLVS